MIRIASLFYLPRTPVAMKAPAYCTYTVAATDTKKPPILRNLRPCQKAISIIYDAIRLHRSCSREYCTAQCTES